MLRWFQQVADGTTVTEVSELENITQSGLSRALARLEAELGTQLLVRSGRTLRMTRAGVTFKRHLDRALHELDDGVAALSELESPDSGTVSLAFQLSLGTWLVPRLVADFHAVHPDVTFELHQIRDELLARRFSDGSVDVEITTISTPDPAVEWRPLLVEPPVLAVARDHPVAAAEVRLADVRDEPFVMLRNSYSLRQVSEDLCQEAGFQPRVAFEGEDLTTIEGFVGAGLGVAIVPASGHPVGEANDGPIRWLRLLDQGATRVVGVAWSSQRRLLPAAQRFLDATRKTAPA